MNIYNDVRLSDMSRFAVVLGLILGLSACSSGSSDVASSGMPSGSGSSNASPSDVDASTPSSGQGGENSGSSGSGASGTTTGGMIVDASSALDAGAMYDGATADGSASDGGVDTSEDATVDGGPAGTHPDLGKGNGSDVVLMGDSWMSNTLQIEGTGGGIAPALMLAAGQPYRNYAVQGVMMLQADSFGPAIPTQYETAKQVNPVIKTVVMTGGGNDIIQNPTLSSDCQMGGAMCKQTLEQINQALDKLWTEMATDGVEDVVMIQYADNVGSTAQSLRGDGGVGTPAICFTGKIRCHGVDTTAAVMSQIAADGIHPLQAANTRIATLVYNLMVQQGMRR
jgi:hypothetical protein